MECAGGSALRGMAGRGRRAEFASFHLPATGSARARLQLGERARRVAAEFRATSSAHVDDPGLRQLIDGLHRESSEFARCWGAHGVLEREGGERTFNHPLDGFLSYRQITFNVASWPDFKLTMLLQSSPG